MSKNFICLLTLLLTIISGGILAQTPEKRVMQDYPKLYSDFKTEVGGQKAHYIIAIDISSSMKSMEASVKSNLKNFISALPDGDKITLIQMADKAETKIVNLTDYTEINNSTRSGIISYIANLKFKKDRETGDGSDGFTMTKLITDGLKKPGSSADMKYVFIFSDFEYWSDKNKYNKNAESWASLKSKNVKESRAKVFGLIIKEPAKVGAVYERELKDIFTDFSKVSCPDDPAILNQWFNTKKSEILYDRLDEYLTKKIENQKDALVLKASGLGKELSITPKSPNLSVVFTEAKLDANSLSEVQKTSESRPLIGSFRPKPTIITVKAKLRAPKYTNPKHPAHTPSDPYNEVDKLLDPQFAEYKIEVYEGKPYLPWYIGWPLVAVITFWVGSIIFHLITFRSKRNWRISASFYKFIRDEWDWGKDIDTIRIDEKDTFTISENSSDCSIQDINATFEVTYKRNLLCIPFINKLKRGYHLNPQRFSGKLEVYVNSVKKDSSKDTIWIGSSGNSFKGCELVLTSSDIVDQTKKKIKIS